MIPRTRRSLLARALCGVAYAAWLALGLLGPPGCVFQEQRHEASQLACMSSEECPGEGICLVKTGRCVLPSDPCVLVDPERRMGEPAADGSGCGQGRICLAAACVAPRCGDGVVTGSETCDGEAECRPDCTRCGDGVIDEGEVCDEGAANSDEQPNACRTTCVPARCGDGVRDLGEGCDDGLGNSDVLAAACRTTCALPTCGDGVVDPGEACDEGAANSDVQADACRTRCVPARCGDGVLDEGEVCDDGAANSDVQPNTCRMTCVPHRCGDGVRDVGEGCDDGTLNDDTEPGACRTTCALPTCGDGILDPGEACDDNNMLSGDGCRDDCAKIEVCGDEVVDVGEDCDDGNDNPADGCDECRAQSWAHALVVSGSLEGRAATGTALRLPWGIATDALGRVYIAAAVNHRVHRVDPDGTIMTLAGTGQGGFAGDGGPATSAQLHEARGIAVDALGRVYIADTRNHRIRLVETDGTITTLAGTGKQGFSGDGGPATSAQLYLPSSIAVDASGRVYIADTSNHRIRLVETDGTITTLAGTGQEGFSGDGGPATSAQLYLPGSIAVDASGRVYIADTSNHRIRLVETDETITTLAGTGQEGFSGDGGPATSAQLHLPGSIAVDASGRLYIGDLSNHRVRRVETDGTITTFAGTGQEGFSGDGGPATSGSLYFPADIKLDAQGRVYIADSANHRVRRVETDGTIRTLAGTGQSGFSGDGGAATSAQIGGPRGGIAVDALGRAYIVDASYDRIRLAEPDGTITTLAGTGQSGFSGDGGPATRATFYGPRGITLDALGRAYIADCENHRVRLIDTDGTITTLAGTGQPGFSGDGGPATSALLRYPSDVAVDALGRVYIADTSNHRVRLVEPDGTITTLAGTGEIGFSGDGGPATGAQLRSPGGITVDTQGRVYVSDVYNHRVRVVEPNGTVSTLAGTGQQGFAGDGGPATGAQMLEPSGIAVDALGRVYIADTSNHRIRLVETDGTITTLAGTGQEGFSGDGGPATSAQLGRPSGIAVDASGRVYIADARHRRVRLVETDGTITTLAGLVHPGGPGPLTRARLYAPAALSRVRDHQIVSVGAFGRALRIDLGTAGVAEEAADGVTVVAGYENAAESAHPWARYAPLLQDARGVAWDPVARALVVTEHETGDLRVLGLDPGGNGALDPPEAWTNATLPVGLAGPAGIAYDAASDTFVVAEEAAHCVLRVTRAGDVLEAPVYGSCGSRGRFPGYLSGPTHVAISAESGAVYVSDTDNHRVLRVDADGSAELVIGDGSVSSAGEGAPARLFPVHAPRQLALDAHGNLYVASTSTVRLVANVDGDADADGDDRVFTLFGGGDRLTFPESDAFCVHALSLDEDGAVYAADACQGYLVKISRVVEP